jgi:hypothetical protein
MMRAAYPCGHRNGYGRQGKDTPHGTKYGIQRELAEAAHTISINALSVLLREEGFARLPRRRDEDPPCVIRPTELLLGGHRYGSSTILQIKPELTRFLNQFDGYFGRVTTRRYLNLYVDGRLSNLPRKSIEPMADAFGEPPRNLQEFLGLFRWDEQGIRDELQ